MTPHRILLTAFGWNTLGGGSAVPRTLARELVRRGREVTVFHASTDPLPGAGPYAVRAWDDDGVALVGIHNRPWGRIDPRHPEQDLDNPAIAAAFGETLDRVRPEVVHLHALDTLGMSILDETSARGIPTVYTPHDFWVVCPRFHLLRPDGALCDGPGDRGRDCATCLGTRDTGAYERRRTEVLERLVRGVGHVIAPSHAGARILVAGGVPAGSVDVVVQAPASVDALWERVGRDRPAGRRGERLAVGFFGTLDPLKGPQLLVEAAQRTDAAIDVHLHGAGSEDFSRRLAALDRRGVVTVHGRYGADGLPGILAGLDVAVVPSIVWESGGPPLVVSECLAARLPVVAARMGGIAEAVEDGRNGLHVRGLSVDDLAGALDRLAAEAGLLERLQQGIEAPAGYAAYVDVVERRYAGARPAPAALPPEVTVRWVGDQHVASSLATINREVCGRLVCAPGIDLRRQTADGVLAEPAASRPADVEVRHQWPPDLSARPLGRLALVQPWEFGAIPSAWLGPLATDVDELWVPSEHVRRMYLDAGLEPDRVHVVPNGVDLDRFRPDGPRLDLDAPEGLRLLFVGGTIPRKGVDVLLAAYLEAFAGRDDVTLVVKDMGGASFYRGQTSADRLRALAADGAGPRVVYLDDELSHDEVAALYRACDVLVHPYRGEGFAMPVLEAMACGLPAVVTAGGPTDEFCPPEAGWRIRSTRTPLAADRIGDLDTAGTPWLLEPDAADLARILRSVADDPDARRRRGLAAREAAERLSWEAVTAAYAERVRALARRPLRAPATGGAPFPLPETAAIAVLATPAWRGEDRLAELLRAWASGTDAVLYLLADPTADGDPERWEAHVVAAAERAGVDLEQVGEIALLEHVVQGDDVRRLHAAVDAYVPLHPACEAHVRLARAVVEPEDVAGWLGAPLARAA